jgi:hypothetical protein
MHVDWTLFARYAAPILGVIVGIVLNRYFEKRPRLVSYMPHSSAVGITPPGGQLTYVYSHSMVVRNAGRKAANNVRLGHNVLPNFSVYPNVPHVVSPLPAGGSEIVFPMLVAGEQVTVTYLYVPPLTWSGVHTYIKSDEGFAQVLIVLPTPQPPPWLRRILWTLIVLGAITVLYAIGEGVVFLVLHLHK